MDSVNLLRDLYRHRASTPRLLLPIPAHRRVVALIQTTNTPASITPNVSVAASELQSLSQHRQEGDDANYSRVRFLS
jgi:hypothetical protein